MIFKTNFPYLLSNLNAKPVCTDVSNFFLVPGLLGWKKTETSSRWNKFTLRYNQHKNHKINEIIKFKQAVS